MEIYTKNVHKALGHTMREFSHEAGIYQVLSPYNDHRGGGGNYNREINIFARTCGCGKWKNIKIPYSRAIKVCQSLRLDATSYIDPCYNETTPFIHIHIRLWCQNQIHCGGMLAGHGGCLIQICCGPKVVL